MAGAAIKLRASVPLRDQGSVLIDYAIPDKPVGGIVAAVKIIGTFPDDASAKAYGDRAVADGKERRVVPEKTGLWIPLKIKSKDERKTEYVSKDLDFVLRTQAQEEEKEKIRQMEEDKRLREEREKEEEAAEDSSTIEFYTKQQIKRRTLENAIDSLEQQAQGLREKLETAKKLIAEADSKNSVFKDKWKEKLRSIHKRDKAESKDNFVFKEQDEIKREREARRAEEKEKEREMAQRMKEYEAQREKISQECVLPEHDGEEKNKEKDHKDHKDHKDKGEKDSEFLPVSTGKEVEEGEKEKGKDHKEKGKEKRLTSIDSVLLNPDTMTPFSSPGTTLQEQTEGSGTSEDVPANTDKKE